MQLTVMVNVKTEPSIIAEGTERVFFFCRDKLGSAVGRWIIVGFIKKAGDDLYRARFTGNGEWLSPDTKSAQIKALIQRHLSL